MRLVHAAAMKSMTTGFMDIVSSEEDEEDEEEAGKGKKPKSLKQVMRQPLVLLSDASDLPPAAKPSEKKSSRKEKPVRDGFLSKEDEEEAGKGKKSLETKSIAQVMMPNPLVLSSDEEEAADELGQRHARTYNKKGHNRKVEEVTYP